jgi:hypothetical protein
MCPVFNDEDGLVLDTFCGRVTDHIPHLYRLSWRDWRISDLLRLRFGSRRCRGAMLARCGRYVPHPPHWIGEFNDELCVGA